MYCVSAITKHNSKTQISKNIARKTSWGYRKSIVVEMYCNRPGIVPNNVC